MKREDQTLTSRQIYRQVIDLSWPILIEMVMASLFGMINMIVVGKYAGGVFSSSANVSAIGLTTGTVLFALALVQSMGVGGTTLIARAKGAGEYHRLEQLLKHVLVLGVGVLLPLYIFGITAHRGIMAFLGAESIVYQAGYSYYRLVFTGFIFKSIMALIAAAVRGVGETRISMNTNLLANGLNMVLSLLLVNGCWFFPELGLTGAGIAVLISDFIAMALMIWYVSSGRSSIQVQWFSPIQWNGQTFKNILRFGLPSAGEQFILRGGVILYTRVVASLGTTVLAAHQIGLNIYTLSFTPGVALGVGATALVGQSLGANDHELADRYGTQAAKFGLLIGGFLACFFFGVRNHFGALYSTDPEVIRLTAIPMTLTALVVIFQIPQLTQAGGLRGAGDTTFPMIATGISVVIVRLFSAYIFIDYLHWGLWGAWLAMLADQAVRSGLITWRFRRGHWKSIAIDD